MDEVVQRQLDAAGVQFEAALEARGREQALSHAMLRPSFLLRPALFADGNRWCALYGDNLQHGVAGFGVSPADAYEAFDREWHKALTKAEG